jgi:hypothetical protein
VPSITVNGAEYELPSDNDTEWGALVRAALSALATSASSVLAWATDGGSAASDSNVFLAPGYEDDVLASEVFVVMPVAGRLTALRAFAVATGTDTASSVTVRKNGDDTTITATLPSAQENYAAADLTHSVSVDAGDKVSIGLLSAGTEGSGPAGLTVSLLFTPS